MKKLILAMICICVLFTGCVASQKSNDSNIEKDSLILVGDIISGLEQIFENESSNYSSDWYLEKYKNSESHLFAMCSESIKQFELCKNPENRDMIEPLLNELLVILDELK